MLLAEYQPAIREALACFEALRRLRFKSDDIYFIMPPAGKEKSAPLCVALRVQGKQWVYSAGFIEGESAAFAESMAAAMKRWNEGHQSEMMEIYRASHLVSQGAVGLLVSLASVGIEREGS